MTTEEIASRFDAKPTGPDRYQAICPAHEDRNPSLSITRSGEKTLLHCHAGCSPESIVPKVGLKMSNLFDDTAKRNGHDQPKREVATYDYHDEQGNMLYQVVRYDPKDFRQRRPDGKGGWIKGVEGVRRVPYHLPKVLDAIREGRPVYIVEGEKDVETIERLGFTGTCNAMGAGKGKWRDEYSKDLRGADVIIIPDNDKPGREHVADFAPRIFKYVKSVRIVKLPNRDDRTVKDVTDWVEAGGEGSDLDELVASTKPYDGGEVEFDSVEARLLSDLKRPDRDDPDELLRNRFLCIGAGLLLCGPTGVGKSALAMQFMLLWGIGHVAFGIGPTRPLKSLIIQAENDDGDMAEMRDGIVSGLNLTPEAAKNIVVVREDRRVGKNFIDEVLHPLLEKHRPDLVWIDPALAYLGGEISGQKDVTPFLRTWLNPLLREFRCAAIIVTHTNKPPTGKEKSNYAGSDFAYLGTGSSEWANWARAILAIRSTGSHTVFELRAGKRGARIGWKDADGQTIYVKRIAHSKEPGVICWEDYEPDGQAPTQTPSKAGRPSKVDEVIALGLGTLIDGLTEPVSKTELARRIENYAAERKVDAKSTCCKNVVEKLVSNRALTKLPDNQGYIKP